MSRALQSPLAGRGALASGAALAWATLGLAALAGCSLRSDIGVSSPATPCNAQAQCPDAEACFLGACRGRSGLLRQVQVEVRPPAETRFGLLQVGGLDLGKSLLNDLAVHDLLPVGGTVVQTSDTGGGGTPVPGAALTFTAREAPIPGRMPSVTVQSDTSGGFTTKLPDLTWDIAVLPQAPLPSLRWPLGLRGANLALGVFLPEPLALLLINGAFTNGPTPLAGARVLPVDAAGNALGAATTTDAAGAFSLVLPPGTPAWKLRVGPRDTGAPNGASGPVPTFDLDQAFRPGDSLALDLGPLPAPASITGTVVDVAARPVAGARVFALSLDGNHWALSRSATAGADGTFTLTVREGKYALEAVPGAAVTDPGLSGEVLVQASAGAAPLTIICPPKVKVTGLVLRPSGTPVGAGAQITATRLPDRLVSGRTAQVLPTDAKGVFQLIGDAGRYRLEIVPPRELGLPHRLVELTLPKDQGVLPDLVLWPGMEAVGTLYARGTATTVPGAAVEFFALDPTGQRAVSIGSAITDDQGRYKAVLPDLADPTDFAQ